MSFYKLCFGQNNFVDPLYADIRTECFIKYFPRQLVNSDCMSQVTDHPFFTHEIAMT